MACIKEKNLLLNMNQSSRILSKSLEWQKRRRESEPAAGKFLSRGLRENVT